ncbi:uncharacterized protein RJT20DRAFT_44167 [Scheffersomyces xylosifermentans]|uniref:uncharacterized protein n=1 Tax=Scheffersomyces xylosifermentans TaxID=1304137 RepID=UPI00315DEA53
MASNSSYQDYYPTSSMVPPISGSSGPLSTNSIVYQNSESKQLPSIYVVNQNTQQPGTQPPPAPPSLLPSATPTVGGAAGVYHYPSSTSYIPPSSDYYYSYYYNNTGNNNNTNSTTNTGYSSVNTGTPTPYPPPANNQRIIGSLGYYSSAASSNTLPLPSNSLSNGSTGFPGYHSNFNTSSALLPILPSTAQNGSRESPLHQGRPSYPISPVSIHDITRENTSSSSSTSSASSSLSATYTSYHTQASSAPIDYSSLVSYTISPSLKRKRRKRKPSVEVEVIPGSNPETYPCDVCQKVFLKPYNLKSHMKTHSTDKPYKCTHCFKTFARSHDKKRHELLHNGVKNFKCEGYLQDGVTKWGCGKKFARSDALSRHFRTETGWLCIRPLMDEAKRLEEGGSKDMTYTHNLDPNHPAIASQMDQIAANSDGYMDNSSLIRRLIQSK